MKRRGNKSHKVPNVKLRPAEKGSYSRLAVEASCWAEDTQAGSDDTTFHDLCPRPLKGVAICATGVPDKPTLFRQALELGAACTPAFTDRVTHLVAVDHGGAKYTCALERKIPIVKPSWITENYQIWLRGDDVDVAKSVEEHRLPIFSGVVVCPSGIKELTRRTEICKHVKAHEGDYLKSLERPVRVTHLLCSGDEETDKMKYAEKFNSRGEAKIHLVWEEWFWDSLEFGGRFDEGPYQVSRPRPERKVQPEVNTPPPSSDIPSQLDEGSSPPVVKPPQPKDMDEAEDEQAFLNVLPNVTLQLWGSLLERRGYEINDGEVILSPSKARGGKTILPPNSPVKPTQRQFGAARSVISQVRRTNSFAPAKEPDLLRQMPFRRAITSSSVFGKAGPLKTVNAGPEMKVGESSGANSGGADSSGSTTPKQIFAGMKIRTLGEAKSPSVRNAVERYGGTISSDYDEDVDFIVVRLVSGSKHYRDEEDQSVRSKYRTECWLEQCIFEDRICAPEEQLTSVPLGIQIPVPNAEKILIAMSGFDTSQAFSLKRLFRALGIVLATTFTPRSTHLLCPSGTGPKFEKAQEWGVPVINLQWLVAMSSSGVIPQPQEFLVPSRANSADQEMAVDIKSRNDIKGKGKAVDKGKQRAMSHDVDDAMDVEVDNMMNDITNDNQPDSHGHPPHKKAKALERLTTINLPNPEPPEKFSFGLPNETLGGLFMQQSSLISPSQSVTSPLVQGPRQQSLPHPSRSASLLIGQPATQNSNSNPNPNPVQQQSGLQRHTTTVLNLDADRDSQQPQPGERVPSSKSPSPMKVPRTHSRLSLSPVKIDHEATKALQESITSLLGKRPSEDGDDAGASTGAIGGGAAAGRNGKRARPQRSKAQSRQVSDDKIAETSARPRTRASRLSNPTVAVAFADGGMDPFETYSDQLNIDNGKSQEESMRVMYEDPGQKAERKRLMNLLKGQTEEESISTLSSGPGSQRRSTRSSRVAGF